MSSSLVYLWDKLTVTTVWNTGETGDMYAPVRAAVFVKLYELCRESEIGNEDFSEIMLRNVIAVFLPNLVQIACAYNEDEINDSLGLTHILSIV